MSHVYKVEVNGAYHAYVEADSTTEAKRIALRNVEVTRLNAGEVIDLVQGGIAIERAKQE